MGTGAASTTPETASAGGGKSAECEAVPVAVSKSSHPNGAAALDTGKARHKRPESRSCRMGGVATSRPLDTHLSAMSPMHALRIGGTGARVGAQGGVIPHTLHQARSLDRHTSCVPWQVCGRGVGAEEDGRTGVAALGSKSPVPHSVAKRVIHLYHAMARVHCAWN